MKPPPAEIGGARVVCYAPVDSRCRPTGNCGHIVGGHRRGPSAGLAICRYENEEAFYLFGCDEAWTSVTDTWHATLEDAKRQAEFEYEGIDGFWIELV